MTNALTTTSPQKFRMTRAEAVAVAERTEDAYSYDNYTSWRSCALVLRDMGYDAREAEAILRSKHTRWAHDCSNKRYGHTTSADLKKYLEDDRRYDLWVGSRGLAQLVSETFPD